MRYKITKEEYFAMLKEQNSLCFICKIPNKKLAVDHCHKTKKNRKLLCMQCNSILGLCKENTLILYSAIKYLQHYKEQAQDL